MAPTNLQHRRTHNLLLISKLLNQRDATSPFTLVLDSLEQSGKPLLAEYLRRANTARVQTIFVSFETLRKPKNVDVFVPAWSQNLQAWQRDVVRHVKDTTSGQRKLLVFDSLNSLAAAHSTALPSLLSSFISPTTSLLALYHTDVPITSSSSSPNNPYSPDPLTLLKYLATTLLTAHSLPHVLARKAARERSVVEPSFGLEEGVEGVLQGLGANGAEGCVLEMEHRRRSGRGVREWYFLPASSFKERLKPVGSSSASAGAMASSRTREVVILLEDHILYRSEPGDPGTKTADEGGADTTFDLGLTEKQRRDREGVVLPYFDAQKGAGGEGGRILYDMGSEDDFDEDEDEI